MSENRLSLQSSANADCDDKQVREREIYVSVCMCVRECVQQSVREKQTQIMTVPLSQRAPPGAPETGA